MDKKLVAKELLKIAKSLVAVGVLDKQFILSVDIDALPSEGDPLQEVSHALMIASRQIKSTGFSDVKHKLIDDNGKKIGYYHARQKPIKGASLNVFAEDADAVSLYRDYVKKGKSPEKAAESALSMVSDGAFDAVEGDKRKEAIKNLIEKGKKKTS